MAPLGAEADSGSNEASSWPEGFEAADWIPKAPAKRVHGFDFSAKMSLHTYLCAYVCIHIVRHNSKNTSSTIQ
jgi:hypothetical protein